MTRWKCFSGQRSAANPGGRGAADQAREKFLILGNKNALTCADVFPLIKENRLWIGVTPMSREIYFNVPQSYMDVYSSAGGGRCF